MPRFNPKLLQGKTVERVDVKRRPKEGGHGWLCPWEWHVVFTDKSKLRFSSVNEDGGEEPRGDSGLHGFKFIEGPCDDE